MIEIWDLTALQQVTLLTQAHESEIKTLASLKERYFISGGNDNYIKVWDVYSYQIVQQIYQGERIINIVTLKGELYHDKLLYVTSGNRLNLIDIDVTANIDEFSLIE